MVSTDRINPVKKISLGEHLLNWNRTNLIPNDLALCIVLEMTVTFETALYDLSKFRGKRFMVE